jgi:hypothetical protein
MLSNRILVGQALPHECGADDGDFRRTVIVDTRRYSASSFKGTSNVLLLPGASH